MLNNLHVLTAMMDEHQSLNISRKFKHHGYASEHRQLIDISIDVSIDFCAHGNGIYILVIDPPSWVPLPDMIALRGYISDGFMSLFTSLWIPVTY